MKNSFILFLGFIIITPGILSGIDYGYSSAFQRGFTNTIKEHLPNIQEKLLAMFTRQLFPNNTMKYARQLTPAVVEEALHNLKDALPEETPMIPFAIAEPTSSDILIYFSILNSCLKNLTQFSCVASVESTVSRSSIEVALHINTSSLEGHYELDVSSYDMHLYGDGDYRIVANGTDIAVKMSIDILMDGSFSMREFLLNISMGKAQLTMTNLLGGDPAATDKLTETISEKMPAEIACISQLIQQTVNRSVVDFTNSYIASLLSWNDVVSMIYDLADM